MTGPAGSRPLREAGTFVALTYAIALGIALLLPHAEVAALLTVAAPVTAVALTIVLTTPPGQRGAQWRALGLVRAPGRWLVAAVLVPAAVVGLSFGAALALGVVDFHAPHGDALGPVLGLGVATTVFAVLFLGEEIGWRGYLLPRLAGVVPGRAAAVATGAIHAVFHLPLLVLTTTYQSDGNRWVVVPMVLATITLAGVWYAWLRWRTGSLWTVSLSHSAFNNIMGGVAAAAVVTSPATAAYVTTETGIATFVVVLGLAGFLLVGRAADFQRPSERARGQAPDRSLSSLR